MKYHIKIGNQLVQLETPENTVSGKTTVWTVLGTLSMFAGIVGLSILLLTY